MANYLMIVTYLMTFFILVFERKKQIALTKTMIFWLEFLGKLLTKIFEATTLFWKLNNEYLNTKIF